MNTLHFIRRRLLVPGALLLTFLTAGSLPAADPDKDSKSPPAAAQSDGTWQAVSAVLGGTVLPEAGVKAITLTLKDGNYEVTVKGEPRPDKGTVKTDTAATPPRMTINGVEGPNKGKTFLAIYETGGKDEAAFLRVCYDLSGKAFPAKFESAAGTQLFLVEYRRAAAPAPPKVTNAAEDAKRQNGVWKPAGAMLGGVKVPAEELKKITLTIKDGNYEVVIDGTPNPDKGTATLDTSVTPKRMTIQGTDGPNRGKTILAIYEMGQKNGADTFRVCYDLSGKAFPAEFKSPKDSTHYLVGYHRAPATPPEAKPKTGDR